MNLKGQVLSCPVLKVLPLLILLPHIMIPGLLTCPARPCGSLFSNNLGKSNYINGASHRTELTRAMKAHFYSISQKF